MNGDLISREALKKDFEERNKACDKWIAKAKDEETKIRADATKHFICEVIMTIDNAPTVDTYTIEDIQEVQHNSLILGAKLAQRPQGKFVEMLNERIEESVCKYCQMNKHCELCEISRVFSIIALTDKEQKEGAE